MRRTLHFYKNRYKFFGISIAAILIGVVFLFINGVKLDIEFQGGTILKYTYTGTIDGEEAGNLIEDTLGRPVSCQLETNMAKDEQKLTINLAGNEAITTQEQEAVTAALDEAYPNAAVALSESLTVEPFMGARFFRNGMIAIALSFFLILVYVGIRFRKIGGLSAGAMAIAALLHDAMIVTSVFIIFQIPLNQIFVAVILTIVGYSINDTIVIYDRVRENKNLLGKKVSPEDLIDISISETLTRTINTSVTVFIAIMIVFIFAQVYSIETIKDFALPMMFGTITGCYSSVCIALPLWTMWRKHKITRGALRA